MYLANINLALSMDDFFIFVSWDEGCETPAVIAAEEIYGAYCS